MGRRLGSSRQSPAIVVAALALVAAIAGTAVAGPDASTSAINKKKVKKIAKKQINKLAPGLSVAHAAAADKATNATNATNASTAGDANALGGIAPSGYLTPAEGDSRYLPRTAMTKLQVTPGEWVATGGDGSVDPTTTLVRLVGPGGAATSAFAAAAPVPSTLQGAAVSVDSFQLCYDATDPDVVALSEVGLTRVSGATPAQPQGTVDLPISDSTDRHDATCRTYSAASPVPVGADGFVDVGAVVQYSGTGVVRVTRLTINLTT